MKLSEIVVTCQRGGQNTGILYQVKLLQLTLIKGDSYIERTNQQQGSPMFGTDTNREQDFTNTKENPEDLNKQMNQGEPATCKAVHQEHRLLF